MADMPEIDKVWIDTHYEELVSLQVELDADPLAFGPKRLNGKIALARTMLGRCERIFLQVSQYLQHAKRNYRMAEVELKVLKDNLFVNDAEVKAGKSVADREALASSKLPDRYKKLYSLELAVTDLETILDVVKAKRADLRDIQARLRDQVKLCQEEIGLGSKWGAKPAPQIDLNPGQGQKALQEFEALIENIERGGGEIHLPPLEDVEEQETVVTTEQPIETQTQSEEKHMGNNEDSADNNEDDEDGDPEEDFIPVIPDSDIDAFFASPDPILESDVTADKIAEKVHQPVEVDIDELFSRL